MGGALKLLPVTYGSFFIGSIALMGFPFTAGFYSKDFILEMLLIINCPIAKFSMFCCFLAVICTTFYSVRLIYFIFFSRQRNTHYIISRTHESSIYILIPLAILSFFSIMGGFLFKETFVGSSVLMGNFKNSYTIKNLFYAESVSLISWDIEELYLLKLFSFFIVIVITFLTFYIYNNPRFLNKVVGNKIFFFVFRFLQKKWYFDIIYAAFTRFILKISYENLLLLWDRGFLENFGPFGGVHLFWFFTSEVRRYHHGNLKLYLNYFGLAFFFILVLLLFIHFDIFDLYFLEDVLESREIKN